MISIVENAGNTLDSEELAHKENAKAFRNYADAKDHVRQLYRQNHTMQTLDFGLCPNFVDTSFDISE